MLLLVLLLDDRLEEEYCEYVLEQSDNSSKQEDLPVTMITLIPAV